MSCCEKVLRARIAVLALIVGSAVMPAEAVAQATFRDEAARVTVEPNVVYGMVSGLALLMDVYRPDRPNGHGVIVIGGSGWHAPPGYGATPLKGARPGELLQIVRVLRAFADAGYTLFVINHRAAPRFRYPDAVHDAQRAVRYVRHHAERFGVDPDRLGALGGSSGGHLVSLLGTLDGGGNPTDPDPVNRESARVQAVVAYDAPADFTEFDNPGAVSIATAFLGEARRPESRALYREASPLSHVSADAAPFLLIHGDADPVVPFRNSELMHRALRSAGVDVELVGIEGGVHGSFRSTHLVGVAVAWMNRRLLDPGTVRELEPLVSAMEQLAAGERLARGGEVSAALVAFDAASRASDRLTIDPRAWDLVCWYGSLHGRARAALPACERAVVLVPGSAGFRHSRGLARALTGDIQGAIDDFEFFVAQIAPGSPARTEREAWIAALRAGRDPFTPELLRELRTR